MIEPTICMKCREPLTEHVSSTGYVLWTHANGGVYDHEPHAVTEASVADGVSHVCDFCADTNPVWLYSCVGGQIKLQGVDTDHIDNGVWAACEPCANLIERRDVDGLQRQRTKSLLHEQKRILAGERAQNSDAILANLMDDLAADKGDPKGIAVREHIRALHTAFLSIRKPGREPLLGHGGGTWKVPPSRMPRVIDRVVEQMDRDAYIDTIADGEATLPGFLLGRPDQMGMYTTAMGRSAATGWRDYHLENLRHPKLAMYWMSNEFVQGTRARAGRVKTLDVRPEEIADERGIVFFEKAIYYMDISHPGARTRRVGIVGMEWIKTPRGVISMFWVSTDETFGGDPGLLHERLGWIMPLAPGCMPLAYYETLRYDSMRSLDMFRICVAVWVRLTSKGIVELTDVAFDGPTRKKYARQGRPAPRVRVVNLRRVHRDGEPGTGTPRGPLKERIEVREHEKMVWYGENRKFRRRVEVQQYIRGPKDAPLRPRTPKVTTVRRRRGETTPTDE